MTLENARVLYAHRVKLGKNVDDILARFPELKEDGKKTDKEEVGKADKEQSPNADKEKVADSNLFKKKKEK